MSEITKKDPPQQLVPERITVALMRTAADDLRRTQERTGLSKTEIANRAIRLYEFIEEQLTSGHDLVLRHKSSGETQLVRLL